MKCKYIVSRWISFSLSIFTLLLFNSSAAPEAAYEEFTVIVDAGHGGGDPGTVGKSNYEKDIALQVALSLRDRLLLKAPNVRVVMTRETDVFIPLRDRGIIAKSNGGDFFVSIHCNAFPLTERSGSETFILGINKGQQNYARLIAKNESILFEEGHKEMYGGFDPGSPEGIIAFRLLKNAFRNESSRLARMIEENYQTTLGRESYGVKQAPFTVLYESGMPAILTEIGFLSNENDEKLLESAWGQDLIAESIFNSITSYIKEVRITKGEIEEGR
ncbi:MAG: N-acetylmuramoyl-L-alanine amidase [Bacteroidota bacterium]